MTQGGRVINISETAGPAAPHPIERLAGRALDLLLPPGCPVCNAIVESAGALCAECWPRVDFIGSPQCAACGLPFEFEIEGNAPERAMCGACLGHPPPYQRARAVMVYGDFSRKMILSFKHADRTDAAPGLGRWLVRAGAGLLAAADLIAPVPLHWTRLFQRRYNQAALLAHVAGRETGVRVVADLIQRRRKTAPQGRMGPAQRRRNVRGAFRIHPGRAGLIQDKRVLLIDDVLTTGATASACARTLLKAGAGAVDVLTLARVVRATS